MRYPAGENEPAAWKAAYGRAKIRKYIWLCIGTALFIAGVVPFLG